MEDIYYSPDYAGVGEPAAIQVPNERLEWLLTDYHDPNGTTTMQEVELAEDLLEARKIINNLKTVSENTEFTQIVCPCKKSSVRISTSYLRDYCRGKIELICHWCKSSSAFIVKE